MYCRNCGKKVSSEDRYCGNCREPLSVHKQEKEVIEIKTIDYNKPAFWLSVVSASLAFLAFVKEIMYIGIFIGVVSLIMIIYILINNKKNKVGNVRNLYTLSLSIVGIITNTMWLLFTLYILPNI